MKGSCTLAFFQLMMSIQEKASQLSSFTCRDLIPLRIFFLGFFGGLDLSFLIVSTALDLMERLLDSNIAQSMMPGSAMKAFLCTAGLAISWTSSVCVLMRVIWWYRRAGPDVNCKSLLCSMFNEQTCTRFTWLFGRSVVTMPKISLKTLYCYIFEKPKVQGHQN